MSQLFYPKSSDVVGLELDEESTNVLTRSRNFLLHIQSDREYYHVYQRVMKGKLSLLNLRNLMERGTTQKMQLLMYHLICWFNSSFEKEYPISTKDSMELPKEEQLYTHMGSIDGQIEDAKDIAREIQKEVFTIVRYRLMELNLEELLNMPRHSNTKDYHRRFKNGIWKDIMEKVYSMVDSKSSRKLDSIKKNQHGSNVQSNEASKSSQSDSATQHTQTSQFTKAKQPSQTTIAAQDLLARSVIAAMPDAQRITVKHVFEKVQESLQELDYHPLFTSKAGKSDACDGFLAWCFTHYGVNTDNQILRSKSMESNQSYLKLWGTGKVTCTAASKSSTHPVNSNTESAERLDKVIMESTTPTSSTTPTTPARATEPVRDWAIGSVPAPETVNIDFDLDFPTPESARQPGSHLGKRRRHITLSKPQGSSNVLLISSTNSSRTKVPRGARFRC
jgi:hypothetical protein